MDYRKAYMKIISNAIKEDRRKGDKDVKGNLIYYERHHILPKSLYPNWISKKSNMVLLTAREHFFCHKLLIKIYPNSHEMKSALWLTCKGNKLQKRQYSSRDYEFARMQFIESLKKYHKDHPEKYKGKVPWNKGMTWKDKLSKEELSEKFGKGNKGKKQSIEFIEKRMSKVRGLKRTESQKVKYRIAAKKREQERRKSGEVKEIGKKISQANSKPIFIPELGKCFASQRECAKAINCQQTNIKRILLACENNKNYKYRGKYTLINLDKEK